MALPVDIDATYSDAGPSSRSAHQKHHDELHRITNGMPLQVRGPSLPTKYAHVQLQHGAVQAAIADLVNANGTADGTIADVGGSFNQATLNNNFRDLSDKVNALLLALRGVGVIVP